jgi:hypothetical protein
MKHFEYRIVSGQIVKYHSRPEGGLLAIPDAGNALIAAPDPNLTNYYVANGTLHSKIAFTGTWNKTAIIANGADLARLRFLPDPCQMTINGDQVTVTGGRLDLTATEPGDYIVELTDVRYIYQSWVVTAV